MGVMSSENQLKENQSDEEEEIEPKLKYVRISNDLHGILQKDAANCIAVHPKFVCVGSEWGMIHLLDHQGNSIRNKELRAHAVAVNKISIDTAGEYVASCSDDGYVFVLGLYSGENDQTVLNIGRQVRSVALDPSSTNGRRFITGDEKLTLHERGYGFLGRLKSTVLCESEGHVNSIEWCGNFVAWSNRTGVRVYDINARCSLGLIRWETPKNSSLDNFRCNLRWADPRTLLIGWADTVRVCIIRKRNNADRGELPEYLVDPISTFRVDFHISGLAPLDQQLVLLGTAKINKETRPKLHIIEYGDSDYTEVCTDSLSLRGYQNYSCDDYRLDVLPDENRFFIVSPKDVVVASPYDPDDRVQWLLQHGRFDEAMDAVSTTTCKRHTLSSVGAAYLDSLLAQGEHERAAHLCVRAFTTDRCLWQEHVYKFARVQQLRSIAPYLPRSNDCRLDPQIYEMVLYEFLRHDPTGFLAVILKWNQPPNLYNTAAVINAVLEHLLVRYDDRDVLLEALAVLYARNGCYDKALSTYLKLRHPGAFSLIREHAKALYPSLPEVVAELMELDADKAVELLLGGGAQIKPEVVIEKLSKNERLLYKYLDALDKKEPRSAAPYHGRLVYLHAVFHRDRLLPFLQRSDQYPIQDALDVCRRLKYHPETVYLLGRMGDFHEALEIITGKLGDIRHALEFCREHDDQDLWDDLVRHSLDNPSFIAYLLPKMGPYVDPCSFVRKMKPGLVIPGLRDALVDALSHRHLTVGIQRGCQHILVADYFKLYEKLLVTRTKGIRVSDSSVCGACHRPLIYMADIPTEASDLVVYNCKHVFHKTCLRHNGCGICHPPSTNK